MEVSKFLRKLCSLSTPVKCNRNTRPRKFYNVRSDVDILWDSWGELDISEGLEMPSLGCYGVCARESQSGWNIGVTA